MYDTVSYRPIMMIFCVADGMVGLVEHI